MPGRVRLAWFLIALAASFLLASPAPAVTIQKGLWGPHGVAESVVRIGDRVFLAGSGVDYVGPYTGSAQFLSLADGQVVPGFPDVYGAGGAVVSCAVPDGSGGWYIGGSFTRVGGLLRSNLAHVDASGAVTAWNPGTNNMVHTMALDGGVVYVGGTFTMLGGVSRSRAGAVNAATGVTTSWNPAPGGTVNTIAVGASSVYLGGAFQFAGGQTRNYIAQVDRVAGAATAFNPNASSNVTSLLLNGGTLYVGGEFTTIGGQTRVRLAAFDTATGLVKSWYPGPVGGASVELELEGNLLWLVGVASVNGNNRDYIAAVDTLTGAVAPFTVDFTIGTQVNAISVENGVVYAAGNFTQIGNSPTIRRRNLAAFDATTGAVLPWNPVASAMASSIEVSGSRLFVGGAFTSLNGDDHGSLIGLDAQTGLPLPIDPQFPFGIVRNLSAWGNTLIVAGQFSQTTPGATPAYLTSYDASTLQPTGWAPVLNGEVIETVVQDDTLYVAGSFTQINGQTRNGIAAFDLTTGALLPWYPGTCTSIRALAVNGPELVIGGAFSTLAGVSRSRLGAIDRGTGAVTAWTPAPNNTVEDVEVAGGRIYASGSFTSVVGGGRNRLACWDAATGALTTWNPNVNGTVLSIAVGGSRVLAAGSFNLVNNSAARFGLAEFDATTGTVTTWNPQFDNSCRDVYLGGNRIYVIHEVGGFGGEGRAYFTALWDPQLVGVEPPVTAAGTLQLTASPNPARGRCAVRLALPRAGAVSVEVLDIAGRRVLAPLENAWAEAGPREIALDLARLDPGLYFVRVRTASGDATSRVAVVR